MLRVRRGREGGREGGGEREREGEREKERERERSNTPHHIHREASMRCRHGSQSWDNLVHRTLSWPSQGTSWTWSQHDRYVCTVFSPVWIEGIWALYKCTAIAIVFMKDFAYSIRAIITFQAQNGPKPSMFVSRPHAVRDLANYSGQTEWCHLLRLIIVVLGD